MWNGITRRPDCYPGVMDSDIRTFIELSGAAAAAVLADHGRSLAAAGTPCELLASATQPELYLLVCRGETGAERAPRGARTWSFRRVEAYR